MRVLRAWLAFATAAAGASGVGAIVGAGGCNGGNTTVTTVDELTERVAAATCAWQFRCCSVPEMMALRAPRYLTEEDCREYTKLSVSGFLAPHALAISDQRQALDPKETAACLAELEAAACNMSSQGLVTATPLAPSCRRAFKGLVQAGEACLGIPDCAPGTHCAFPGIDSNGMPDDLGGLFGDDLVVAGACVASAGEGAVCNTSRDCDESRGLYCRGTDFRCRKFAEDGDECMASFGFEGPAIEVACKPGLICDPARGKCAPMPRDGDACLGFGTFGASSPCDTDPSLALSCVGTGFNGTGICESAAAEGEACGGSALPPCAMGLICVFGPSSIGTCQPAPGTGEPCTPDGWCRTPAVCNPGSLTCDIPGSLREREPCGYNAACGTLLCGDPTGTDDPAKFVCLPNAQMVVTCSGVNRGPTFVGGTGGIGGFGGGILPPGVGGFPGRGGAAGFGTGGGFMTGTGAVGGSVGSGGVGAVGGSVGIGGSGAVGGAGGIGGSGAVGGSAGASGTGGADATGGTGGTGGAG